MLTAFKLMVPTSVVIFIREAFVSLFARRALVTTLAVFSCLFLQSYVLASEPPVAARASSQTGATYTPPSDPQNTTDTHLNEGDRIEAAVIHPYRSANIGSEVKGIIGKIHFEEGDRITRDSVILEVLPDRYKLLARKAEERVKGVELSVQNAEEDLKVKEELFSLNAGTQQDVIKARTQVDIEKHRLAEAREELKLAKLDLKSCEIKAPFDGYLAVRYKQPDEAVNQYDNVFAVVDKSKVYAVANVPENRASGFRKESRIRFTHSSGKKYEGIIDKVGVLVDPQSKTLKVHVLIDNPDGILQVGTTGSLEPVK